MVDNASARSEVFFISKLFFFKCCLFAVFLPHEIIIFPEIPFVNGCFEISSNFVIFCSVFDVPHKRIQNELVCRK